MKGKVISKVTSGVLLCTMAFYSAPIFAYTKDETVYSKLDTSGNSYNTLVNSHLINNGGQNLIDDLSDLINIKNVNGDEKFSQAGNSLVWNAEGSDIYYQGEAKKDLPIECKIKYELNGEEISSKDLAGKSGKVKITIEYINKDAHLVNINGKSETLYTPFVVVCGTILDNNIHKNVEINSGKVIDDGNKTIALGMAFPGLNESLGLSKDKINIPQIIEITMDSKDFELGNIASFITPKVFEEDDLSVFDDLNKIYSKINVLQSSSKELVEGSNTLKSGTNLYYENSKMFNSAVKQVSNGTTKVNSGYSSLDNGIKTLAQNVGSLETGAKQINEGTKALNENLNPTLQEFIDGLNALQNGTLKLKQGSNLILKELNTSLDDLKDMNLSDNSAKIKELNLLIEGNKKAISSLEAVNSSLAKKLENETDESIIANIKLEQNANNSAISILNKNIEATNETINTLKLTDIETVKALQSKLTLLNGGIESLNSGMDELAHGASKLEAGSNVLSDNILKLSQGADNLYKGTVAISSGINSVDVGSTEIKKGLISLAAGTSSLQVASNELTKGAGTISGGASTLAEGMTKFDEEGIKTICNYINGDLKDISVRVQKLQDLAEEYKNFTMLDDKAEGGNVKFIMIMDAIKKNDENKEQAIIVDKK